MKANKESLRNGEDRRDSTRSSYSELPEGSDSTPVKTPKKDSRRGNKENREIRLLGRSKVLKVRNDPDRFSGEGINFKAKIIGTENVLDARGNRMCQGALQRLKSAVKTSGDHKKRIILNISLHGIMIKDEKSGELLHHHPIHKISFISQDTSDNRAFGYVFGSPQTGHVFFGIKTEKIASQVVLTLRDLFLTALEIKKKEIESAREDDGTAVSQKVPIAEECVSAVPTKTISSNTNGASGFRSDYLYSNVVALPEEGSTVPERETGDSLLDLQFTMDSLEQGISHMDSNLASSHVPGFSFSEDEISESSCSSMPHSLTFKLYQETLSVSSRSSSTSDYNAVFPPEATKDEGLASEAAKPQEDRYAVFLDIDALPSIFDTPPQIPAPLLPDTEAPPPLPERNCATPTDGDDDGFGDSCKGGAFAELDPLGDHPYVDKKDFFQELKKPPKKVLKELANCPEGFEADPCCNGDRFDPFHLEGPPFNPFESSSPPLLPPKTNLATRRSGGEEPPPWNSPFNPFEEMPPPSSPPPPPPPRLPASSPPPPPRPPCRAGVIPTPPLPKRRPLAVTQRTWYSFDVTSSSTSPPPPLPCPARKSEDTPLPPIKQQPSSASPGFVLLDTSSKSTNPADSPSSFSSSRHDVTNSSTSSTERTQQEFSSASSGSVLPDSSASFSSRNDFDSSTSSAEKTKQQCSSSSFSSRNDFDSSTSSAERNGSANEEALLLERGVASREEEVFNEEGEEQLSPDSIFRRKDDPFADEFFLTLPKKTSRIEFPT